MNKLHKKNKRFCLKKLLNFLLTLGYMPKLLIALLALGYMPHHYMLGSIPRHFLYDCINIVLTATRNTEFIPEYRPSL